MLVAMLSVVYLQAPASLSEVMRGSLVSKPQTLYAPDPTRFEYRTDCEPGIDVLYIARQSTNYTRVDDYCIDEEYIQHTVQSPPITSTPTCTAKSCGYSRSHKGYFIEPSILESISSAARMLESKQQSNSSKYHEDSATVQSTSSTAITKYKLDNTTKCASKLDISTSQLVGSKFHLFQSEDLHDHMASRYTFFEVSNHRNIYRVMAHFERTFTQRDKEITITESIACESPKIISFVEGYSNYSIEIISEKDNSWGIFSLPTGK